MNPFEEKLAQFLADETMYGAVRGILEQEFDLNKVIGELGKNQNPYHVTNQVLGEVARACGSGRELLVKGFKEIDKFKRQEKRENEINPNMV